MKNKAVINLNALSDGKTQLINQIGEKIATIFVEIGSAISTVKSAIMSPLTGVSYSRLNEFNPLLITSLGSHTLYLTLLDSPTDHATTVTATVQNTAFAAVTTDVVIEAGSRMAMVTINALAVGETNLIFDIEGKKMPN